MRQTNANQSQPAARDRAPDAVAVLAAAGLRAQRVERCPDPGCPICLRRDRAAA
jgi:hypothetical protein